MLPLDFIAAIIRNHPAKRAVRFISGYLPADTTGLDLDIVAVIEDNPAEQAVRIISDYLRPLGYNVEIDMSPVAIAMRDRVEAMQPTT